MVVMPVKKRAKWWGQTNRLIDLALARVVAAAVLRLGLYEREHPLDEPEEPEGEDAPHQAKPQEDASMRLTEKEKQALEIIAAHKGIRAKWLAKKMWPDSIAHRASYRSGQGSVRGKGAWLMAGSFVGKLIKKGLAWRELEGGYKITRKGLEALAKENACPKKST
jgi:hypothetical protein